MENSSVLSITVCFAFMSSLLCLPYLPSTLPFVLFHLPQRVLHLRMCACLHVYCIDARLHSVILSFPAITVLLFTIPPPPFLSCTLSGQMSYIRSLQAFIA